MSRLDPKHTGLLVIDAQERLFPFVERADEVARVMQKAILAAEIFRLPIVVTEQNPAGLGFTISCLRQVLPTDQVICQKTAFSCWGSAEAQVALDRRSSWLLVGVEAHICVLQTVRDLIESGLHVVLLSDAVSSRSLYDLASGVTESRELGARVSTLETVLFELLGDSSMPHFQAVRDLVKRT